MSIDFNKIANSIREIVTILYSKFKEMINSIMNFSKITLQPLIDKYGSLNRAGNILTYNEKLRKRRLLYINKGHKKKRR